MDKSYRRDNRTKAEFTGSTNQGNDGNLAQINEDVSKRSRDENLILSIKQFFLY
jgi:hypothetical protein